MMLLSTHPSALNALEEAEARVRRLWLPPEEVSIEEWARKNRVLPSDSGRPGEWRADPIQREIQESIADPSVREVVFMKSTRLGWSEICNNALGWGVAVHKMAMMMLQPSRDTAESYCKERLDQMIESTPALWDLLRQSTSKGAGSTTRYKRFRNGASFFVASAANGREMRSRRSRFGIEDEVDGYLMIPEGDPDVIFRKRMDEFGRDAKILIGSTPGLPSGLSRVEKAYNRSSMGLYLNPCPRCNAMEPFLWRNPANPKDYLLKFERDKDNQVIAESVYWTCIRCGEKIPERRKLAMMEAGHWQHRRPAVEQVKGYWANGLYAVTEGHWAKMAQSFVDAAEEPGALRAFVNLDLAETYNDPGESAEPEELRKRADKEVRDRAIVPDGVAILIVTVDLQTAGIGRLEAQVVGFKPDERAYLVDFQVFPGDPKQEAVYEDLDAWLLEGWKHQNGAQMTPHLVFLDARDGNVRDSVYNYCSPRVDRWIFPQMGMDSLASKGWCEESTNRKQVGRLFLTSTDDTKRALMSRLAMPDPNAPKSIHLPSWISKEYLDQLGAEKRMPVVDPKTRKVSYRWVSTRPRNESLDLWSYALSGWWAITKILAPHLGGPDGRKHLEDLAAQASQAVGSVAYTSSSGRRIRSKGTSAG